MISSSHLYTLILSKLIQILPKYYYCNANVLAQARSSRGASVLAIYKIASTKCILVALVYDQSVCNTSNPAAT